MRSGFQTKRRLNSNKTGGFTLLNQLGSSTLTASRTRSPDLTWWMGPDILDWTTELETWGSGHTLIVIIVRKIQIKKVRRKIKIITWHNVRLNTGTTHIETVTLITNLQSVMMDNTIYTTINEDQPSPNVPLLKLWARWKPAEVNVSRNPEDRRAKAEANRLTTKARRHKKQLTHRPWIEWCSTIGSGPNDRAL